MRLSLLLAKEMTQERRNGANDEHLILGLVVEFRNHIFGIREIEEIITFSDPMISNVETGNAVKSMKLLAVATGEYTKAELNKDATLGWTKKAQELIDADKAVMAQSANNG